MNHDLEFSNGTGGKPKFSPKAIALAQAYARTFGTPDGTLVLRDLQAMFAHNRTRFPDKNSQTPLVPAAHIDGQCMVLDQIEQAIKLGSPSTTN